MKLHQGIVRMHYGCIRLVRHYTIAATNKSDLKVEEVKLVVPWGHISGKWWGDRKSVPIIALHEFRQNAAAFDQLIPKLNVASVLALDLPGHGQSSHFPKGRFITHLDFLIALRYVSMKMPPSQMSFIGHGFGSYLALLYAASYFKQTDTVISIECSRHVCTELSSGRPNCFGEVSDCFLEVEKNPLAHYTEPEIISMIKRFSGRISDEAAKILFSRAVHTEGQKMFLSNDPRYKMNILFTFNDEDIMAIAKHVRAKVAVIRNVMDDELAKLSLDKVTQSPFFDENTQYLIRRKGPITVRLLHNASLEGLRDSCRLLVSHDIRAPQHILLDSSDQVAPILNSFLAINLESHEIYQS